MGGLYSCTLRQLQSWSLSTRWCPLSSSHTVLPTSYAVIVNTEARIREIKNCPLPIAGLYWLWQGRLTEQLGDLKVSPLSAVQSYLTCISVFQHYQPEDPVLTSLNINHILNRKILKVIPSPQSWKYIILVW